MLELIRYLWDAIIVWGGVNKYDRRTVQTDDGAFRYGQTTWDDQDVTLRSDAISFCNVGGGDGWQ